MHRFLHTIPHTHTLTHSYNMSVLLSSRTGLLKSSMGISPRCMMTASASVRFESSFSFLGNPGMLLKKQLKQSKRKAKRLSSTVTTTSKYHQRSPCADLSAGSNDPKAVAALNRKYKFYSLPRVPSTGHLDREEVNLSALYSGYRPMFFNHKHFDASNSTNTSTLYEFSMDMDEPNPMWYNSATGLETFEEWDNIPSAVINELKPFVPPPPSGVKKAVSKDTVTQQPQLVADPAALLEQMSGLLQKRRGRKKPVFTLIHSKKYPHN